MRNLRFVRTVQCARFRSDSSKPYPNRKDISQGKNPIDRRGKISLCAVCGSRNHWARICPDKTSNPTDGLSNEQIAEKSCYLTFASISNGLYKNVFVKAF